MLTQDPIGLAGGINLYEYAGSNPVAFSDPYGLRATTCPPCEEALRSPIVPLRVVGGIAAAGVAVYAAAKAASEKLNDYKFVTYTRTNAATGQVYSGRTSGFGDPTKIVATRAAGHDPRLAGFGPAKLDQVAPGNLAGYQAIRGANSNSSTPTAARRARADRRQT